MDDDDNDDNNDDNDPKLKWLYFNYVIFLKDN